MIHLLVNQAGLPPPPETRKTAPENWMVPCVITRHLIAALRPQEDLWTANHTEILIEGRGGVHKWSDMYVDKALD